MFHVIIQLSRFLFNNITHVLYLIAFALLCYLLPFSKMKQYTTRYQPFVAVDQSFPSDIVFIPNKKKVTCMTQVTSNLNILIICYIDYDGWSSQNTKVICCSF